MNPEPQAKDLINRILSSLSEISAKCGVFFVGNAYPQRFLTMIININF